MYHSIKYRQKHIKSAVINNVLKLCILSQKESSVLFLFFFLLFLNSEIKKRMFLATIDKHCCTNN